ncbi:hypothetical protein SBRV1_gp27 [Sulfolobales Beppu rod-shaped virus 1]|uniref:Uncharacterized protein n=1 Tax=Sulfolobales Beppu rod-shaped virus 1 TaxID=2493121 RepID=A0A3Q8Q3Z3_9VIRU|nr:hypothetical protein QIT32_gp27 [Sulfolobales Beppu rod-shaped virus 1]AZI75916.1 hypothetical protein SBRV1_gp27 [Sulfolobales Beppu rod-shaped virus 1]
MANEDFINDIITFIILVAIEVMILIGIYFNPTLINDQHYFYLFYSIVVMINSFFGITFGKSYNDKVLEANKDSAIIIAQGVILFLLITFGLGNNMLFDNQNYQIIVTTLLGFFAGILGVKISTKYI